MRKKSLKINAILNVIRVLLTIIFPLITYPYASKVLGTTNLGKVQFGHSLIIFISLIATLGINAYAIREGAKIRDDKKKIDKLSSELFTISVATTTIAYLTLFTILLTINKFSDYRNLILIQSLSIIFTTIGVDWILQIYEDYLFITIRSLVFNLLGMIALFVFVKQPEDYYIYSLITVFSTTGAHLLNILYARKYCKFRLLLFRISYFKKHLKSLLILFSNSLAIQLYINSDQLMLGFITGDYRVGIYSVAVKIYSIIKNLINAVTVVAIPRLSYLLNNSKKDNYNKLLEKITSINILIIIPALVGLCVLSKEIILIVFGSDYVESINSLRLLSIALIFSVFSNLYANAILIVNKREKIVLKSTIVAASTNIVLNLFLIPYFNEIGAAITTIIAEVIVLGFCIRGSRDIFSMKKCIKTFIPAIIEAALIIVFYNVISATFNNMISVIILTIMSSITAYILLLIVTKNALLLEIISEIKGKLLKHKKGA